ncbi:hypothetical protein [Nitrospira calida]|jgi:hypothetical protein
MKRRKWDAKTKTSIVLEGLKGKSVTAICQDHQISQAGCGGPQRGLREQAGSRVWNDPGAASSSNGLLSGAHHSVPRARLASLRGAGARLVRAALAQPGGRRGGGRPARHGKQCADVAPAARAAEAGGRFGGAGRGLAPRGLAWNAESHGNLLL